MDLKRRFKQFLREKSLINTGETLLLGVSGGPDSLTMLDLFFRLREQNESDFEFVVFHLNHCFRSGAAQEAEFVREFCQKRSLEVNIKSFDVPSFAEKEGLTPEEAARKVRFNLMKQLGDELGIKKAALAHNRDDLVETVLFNMFRGSGLGGLKGIEPRSEVQGLTIIHPLLEFSRQEIESYCGFRSLNPVHDPTNEQLIYTRNIIRNKILPLVEEEINPAVKKVIAQMSKIISSVDNFIEQERKKVAGGLILKWTNKSCHLELKKLKSISTVIRRRIIKEIISELKGDPDDIYFEHYRAVDDLIFNSETGKKINLKEDIGIIKIYDELIIYQGRREEETENYCFELPVPGQVQVPGSRIIQAAFADGLREKNRSTVCYCDLANIKLPLKVRNRRAGDRFQPLGMKGRKKVKDFFIDEKIPVHKRDLIPLVVDDKGEIVWIAGLRMNENFKVKKKTEQLIRLELRKVNEKI
ncbi:MAG: tRNA lysidine(34) synthetase TilS [bacterium]